MQQNILGAMKLLKMTKKLAVAGNLKQKRKENAAGERVNT